MSCFPTLLFRRLPAMLPAAVVLLAAVLFAGGMPRAFAEEANAEQEAEQDEAEQEEAEQEEEAAESKEEQDEPTELRGVFEAARAVGHALNPKEWKEFVVREAVPHGSRVRGGQVLISFEKEVFEERLADVRRRLQRDEVSLRQAEENLALKEKAQPIALESAERADALAVENLANFIKTARPRSIRDMEFSVEHARNSLRYQQEELDQLERMYRADDLTEETEEIILTRQRNAVRAAEYNLERIEANQESLLSIDLPRQEEELKQAVRDRGLALQRLKATQPLELNQDRLALEQQRIAFEQLQQTLADLREDRELLALRAEEAGVVYYGAPVAGRWTETAQMRRTLREGGTAPLRQTLVTVVRQRPMSVRVAVPEEHLHRVRAGLEVKVKPHGFPDLELSGSIESIELVPVADGQFEAVVEVNLPRRAEMLMPGMNATVLLPVENQDK